MNKRERIMALAVAALAPIALLFWGFTSISGGLQKKTDQIIQLQSRATQLGSQERDARFAMARLANYRSESLPNSAMVSSNCRTWLEKMANDHELESATVSVPKVTELNASTGENTKELAMTTYSYDVKGLGTPRRITEFLYRLNEAKLLQRSTLTLNPEKDKAGRGKITGRWRMHLNVEVADLPDADREGEFELETRPFSDKSLEDYHSVVSRRNLFGPENDKPKFASESDFNFEPGGRMKIPLEVEESDRGLDHFDPEKFQFILESSDIEGLEIVQSEEGSRKAELKVPDGLEEGEYSAIVKTIDNGWPYKEQTKEITIVVAKPKPKAGPKPARLMAKDTYLQTIQTKNGVSRVWINIKPMGEWLKLAVGESFDLDGMQWTVKAINKPIITLARGEEILKFRMRGNLATPINEGDEVTKR